MVGIPVNKNPAGKSIVLKKMVPGKLLTGTVKGGTATINKAYLLIKRYITDRNLEEAALPFEVPITNRCAQRDTTKWITKICYPVF